MREVTVSRRIDATAVELSSRFDPPAIVEAEGSFTVADVREDGDATVVVASGPGMSLPLRFEYREDALYYTQEGEQGPFEYMETWLEFDEREDGTEVRFRSSVSLAAPLPFGDRIAAWKRKGELERALEAMADAFQTPRGEG
ncbi:SRPBCC family protein [Natronococcus jeotgali]|uniref:Polyketide cyclase/dehydrase n=1 Tax=Natronococcus jeotgali DSM 18795 TaxID=1227498 RepID=L9XD60_9EURY|nr:polyketide cyclase/dehydrase [Natronococcus jeotgali]ELY58543.1 polyketide cyclase/dehydrase [Natronococcus jeotgali DSM 18795]